MLVAHLLHHTDAVTIRSYYFGAGTGQVHLSHVTCTGSESHLINCSYSLSVRCHYWQIGAGVRCQGTYVTLHTLIGSYQHLIQCHSHLDYKSEVR